MNPIDPLLIGESRSMRSIKDFLPKVAATDCNVLVTGETGTGKEQVVRLIHEYSPRHDKPLMCVNCAALPDSLLESELFGYEKGAFTGAGSAYAGKLRGAEGGTVFFDEIGDMSPYAQAKILRAIESREIHHLGGTKSIPLDIRIVAATNQNLDCLVAEHRFRSDLYYRLNVARIHLPPLRDRKEDIPLLADYYIGRLNERFGRRIEGLSVEALFCLLCYQWPGNVRELKNLLEAIFIDPPLNRISLSDLPEHLQSTSAAKKPPAQNERELLLSALFSTRWNKSQAARKLHWSRMTLYRKMAKYHIEDGDLDRGTVTTP